MNGPARKRILLTRLLAIPLIVLQLVTTHAWPGSGFLDLSIEIIGITLLGIAALGRAWCSLFISGRKTHRLVTVGPYSVVRNPLYVFSFIGAIGIGLCSENIILLIALLTFFFFYYPSVIKKEEEKLLLCHGLEFINYAKRVPQLLPALSLYSCPGFYEIDTRRVLKTLCDCLGFLCIYPCFEIIEYLREVGCLPILATIP